MSRCYYHGTSNRGNELWGNWVCTGTNIEDAIVQFCRNAFQDSWKQYWIDPLYFDDRYFRHTETFFNEVGVHLYPKLSPMPKRKSGMSDTEYKSLIWNVAHRDIVAQSGKVEPICIIVRGRRTSDDDERIISVKQVNRLPQNREN